MIFCTLFTSLGQIMWKYGVGRIDMSHFFTLFNLPFMFGFVSYGIGASLMLVAFKKGELSILYPIVATGYVWVSMFSPLLFPGDSYNLLKVIGVGIILVSVSVLGLNSSSEEKIVKKLEVQNG